MRTRYRTILLVGALLLTLSAWAYASELGEPPEYPGAEAGLLADDGVQAASGSNLQSGDKSLDKLSRQEISVLLSENPLTLPAVLFDVAPSVKAPYATGKLKEAVLQAARNRLNALRRIAGLKPVALDDALNENAQYGAVLLAASTFSHSPPKPDDMDDDFYQKGKTATSSSNIASGYSLTGAVDGFMDDSDAGNIPLLGHRRWQLNPAMGKVGFGYANRRTTEKVFDKSAAAGDYDFVAWPTSGNFPAELFGVNQAWSVSLNPDRYAVPAEADLTVTLRRDDGKVWTLSGANFYAAANSGLYFHVDTGGYGIRNCIIFRPDGVEAYNGTYTVRISGLKDKSGKAVDEFSYQTTFFEAAVSLSGLEASGGTASVTVKGEPGADAVLCFAAFDGNGKFLSVAVREISSPGTYSAAVDGARVSVFLMNTNGKLLCQPVSTT